jgi:polyisoprenoid-binding protein YceI
MLGVTKPITLTVNVEPDPSTRARSVALSATGTLRRSDFGMGFGLPLISDTLELAVKTRAFTDE